MLRKLLGSGLDLILKNETVSRATAGIAAAGTAFYGMHCLGGHLVSGIEYAGLIGGSALSAGYLAFHSSWWHASRFLRDTGKGLGFLREKKKPAEKKGSLLWRLPLEHPIMASYLAVEGYVGGRMLADWEFWKYMKTDVAISSAGVFAGLYASLSVASHLFHPNNIGRNIPLLKAEACELIGMRKKAIKIMECIENPAREHSLYLASLRMKENRFGEALTAMRDGAESKNSELFHPSPMFSNLNTAREIGEMLAIAEKEEGIGDIVRAAAFAHVHNKQKSMELWEHAARKAAQSASPEHELEIMVAKAYFLDSAGDSSAMTEWKRVVEQAIKSKNRKMERIGDHDVYKFDFGVLLGEAFALKKAENGQLQRLKAEKNLTERHKELIATAEFLTAETITIVELNGKYYLAKKYARGSLLSKSDSIEDYMNAARFLAREHARMERRPGEYNGRTKLADKLAEGNIPKSLAGEIVENSDVFFFFRKYFDDRMEMDAHNEQRIVISEGRLVMCDVEDKGNCPPYEDVAKLCSHGTNWSYEQKREIAEAYAENFQTTDIEGFKLPFLVFPAAMASSLNCAMRYLGFVIGKKKPAARIDVARNFMRNGISDARNIVDRPLYCLSPKHVNQLEWLADTAERELLPRIA